MLTKSVWRSMQKSKLLVSERDMVETISTQIIYMKLEKKKVFQVLLSG